MHFLLHDHMISQKFTTENDTLHVYRTERFDHGEQRAAELAEINDRNNGIEQKVNVFEFIDLVALTCVVFNPQE